MAQVTIADDTPRDQYSVGGTPTTGPWTISFPYFSEDDIKVYFDGTLKTITTDYTISGTAVDDGFSGGTVTATSSQSDITVTIERDVPVERTTDFPVGPFNVSTLNTTLDKIFAIMQWLETKIGRAAARPFTSTETYSLNWPDGASAAGKAIMASTSGLALGPEADDITNAQTYASNASTSASNAATSETNAATSASNASTSETNAATSETNASNSAAAAAASAAGIFWKEPVVNATTANITLSGEQTIDGVLTSTSRILVKNQTNAAENGVYVTASGAWARATPLDTWDEHVGAAVIVSDGTTNADTAWICTVDAGGTLETTDITWGQLSQVYSTATTSSEGITEYATAAEVTTGTDATRSITPDALANSNYGTAVVQILVFDDATDCATGDGAGDVFFRVPSTINGFDLVGVAAQCQTAGTTGTMDVQIHNVTQAADMLTTKITIDSAETDSSTAATAAVIDTANDDVATGDQIRIDVDAVHTTAAKGLLVELQFRLP